MISRTEAVARLLNLSFTRPDRKLQVGVVLTEAEVIKALMLGDGKLGEGLRRALHIAVTPTTERMKFANTNNPEEGRYSGKTKTT